MRTGKRYSVYFGYESWIGFPRLRRAASPLSRIPGGR